MTGRQRQGRVTGTNYMNMVKSIYYAETDISTQKKKSKKNPWIFQTDWYGIRKKSFKSQTVKGKKETE